MNVRGARVAITGGSGGIGSALASSFASAGADVVTMDLPGRGASLDLDVSDRASVQEVFKSMVGLDVLVVNAGTGVAGLIRDLTASDWDKVINVNIKGTVNTLLAALPLLRNSPEGSVVMMASLSGLVPTPLLTPYAMTKHALVGLADSLRPELERDGINVTLVCPGPVDTSLLDVPSATLGISVRRYLSAAAGKPITPDALAAAVLDAVRRGEPLVIPGRAALVWRLQRLAPKLTAKQIAKNMTSELRAIDR
jgi:short-subunit dehydrogenase